VANAFGVEHVVFSKASNVGEAYRSRTGASPAPAKESNRARRARIAAEKAAGTFTSPREAAVQAGKAPEAPKIPNPKRRTAPSREVVQAVDENAPRTYEGYGTPAAREWKGRHPARGIKHLTWEITGSQARNWAIGAGLAAGAAYGAKKISDRNRTVHKAHDKAKDAAATGLGGAAGLATAKTARNVAGWVGRETVKDQRYKNWDNTSDSPHRKAMEEHNKKYGATSSNPDVDFDTTGKPKAARKALKAKKHAYFRNYPLSVPGGRGQRILAMEGRMPIKGSVLAGGAVAGGLAAHHYYQKQKNVTVAKKDKPPHSDAKRVPDYISPMLPASTVRAYDNSHGHKLEAGVKNFASKTGGAAIGGGLGLGTTMLATHKIPALKNGLKIGSKKAVSSGTLRGWTQSSGAGAGGALGGTIGGAYSLKRIEENPRHRYQQN